MPNFTEYQPESDHDVNETLAQNFKAAFEAVSGHAHIVKNDAEAIRTIAEIVKASGASRIAFAELPDAFIDDAVAQCGGVEVLRPPYASASAIHEIDQVNVGITGANFGIAETGTLAEVVFDDASRLCSSLPRTHIGVVRARDLVPTLRGSAERMNQLYATHTKNIMISFISGPSRTGDIEMILTLGVHGPEYAHAILILGDDA